MADDKVNISLTIEANNIAEKINESGFFEDKLDIAKFALAFALKERFDTNSEKYLIGEGRGASWNVGSVDGDKYLHNLLTSIYPELTTPYRQIELLMNIGLIILGKKIEEEGIDSIISLM